MLCWGVITLWISSNPRKKLMILYYFHFNLLLTIQKILFSLKVKIIILLQSFKLIFLVQHWRFSIWYKKIINTFNNYINNCARIQENFFWSNKGCGIINTPFCMGELMCVFSMLVTFSIPTLVLFTSNPYFIRQYPWFLLWNFHTSATVCCHGRGVWIRGGK